MTVAKSLPHLWQKVRKLLIPKLFLSYSCIFSKNSASGRYPAFLGRSCKRTIRTSVTSPVICCSLALSFTDGTGISYVSYFRSYPRPEFFEEAPEQVSFAIRPYPKTACPNRGCDSAAKRVRGSGMYRRSPFWLFRLSERVTSHRPSRRSGTEKREVRRCWSAWRQPARCGTHSERPQARKPIPRRRPPCKAVPKRIRRVPG